MNVLHVFKAHMPDREGGAIRFIDSLASGLTHHGVGARVLALGPRNEVTRHDGYDAIRISPRWRLGDLCRPGALAPELRRQSTWADVVHYHMPWPVAALAHRAIAGAVPTVITHHADLVRPPPIGTVHDRAVRAFYRSADAVVATSEAYAASSRLLSHVRPTLRVIPIGIPPLGSVPALGRGGRVESGPGDDQAVTFLFVGVFRRYKALHVLVRAAAGMPHRVVLAGDGPERPRLERLARRLSAGNVTFAGRVSDSERDRLLARCDAFVLPSSSRAEAFGICLLEAARYGKPMISCELGGGSSFINADGVTGLVVPPGNVQAFRSAMDAMASDAGMRTRMGHAALERFGRLFTASRMLESYLGLYRQLAGRPS